MSPPKHHSHDKSIVDIHTAAKVGTVKDLERLLGDQPGSISELDFSGCCPLHVAAKAGNKDAVTYLLQHGAHVDGVSQRCSVTALHHAIVEGHKDVVDLLVSNHGASITFRTEEGLTPLLTATKHKKKDAMHVLLRHDAAVNDRTLEGETALILASRAGAKDLVALLLDQEGIDIEAQDNEGMTALMYAVRNRRSASLIRLLIDKGADLEHRDKNGCTALFYAGSTEAQVLVANNANKEARDRDGWTPLMHALRWGGPTEDIAQVLVGGGADVSARDLNGLTLLSIIVRDELPVDLLESCLEFGIDPNIYDNEGETALHIASRMGNKEAIPLLLKNGADPTLKTKQGKTASELATENSFDKVASMINKAHCQQSGPSNERAGKKQAHDKDAPKRKAEAANALAPPPPKKHDSKDKGKNRSESSGKKKHAASDTELYRTNHMLDADQPLMDGFKDDYIVIDARSDKHLEAVVDQVKDLFLSASTRRMKAILLALYVSNRMGGSQPTMIKKDTLGVESLSKLELGDVGAGSEVAIGTIGHGGSRHRALLFKYLCGLEGVDIPCRLVRGSRQKHHRHEAWTAVKVDDDDDQWYVMDLVNDPCQLYEEGSSQANAYLICKKNEESKLPPEPSQGPLSIACAGANRSLPPVDFQGGEVVLHKQLGEGGFGKVYQCSIQGYTCAVKRQIRAQEITEDDRREMDNLRTLQHDHILRFLGFQHHTHGYEHVLDIFTELADGTLEDYLLTRRKTTQWKEVATKKSPLTFAHFKRLAEQILLGLEYLHSLGKMHRDIKPENVLVFYKCDSDGKKPVMHLKLSDFGLTRDTAAPGHTLTREVGTPGYMAIEVRNKKRYSTPADLWSFGMMCCVMLTLEDEHRAFKEINNYPVPLVVNLVRSLMYSDPAKRPTATMALQILNDLHV